MDPQQIGSTGMAATAGGGVLGAFGQLASGFSNSNMYKYQASVAKLNQTILEQDAEFANEQGREQNQQYGLKAGQRMGQIKTSEAASGFDVRSGSNAQVQKSQQTLDRLDMAQIRSNVAKTAYNYENQAKIAGSQAGVYSSAASNSMAAGFVGLSGGLLGTAGSVSNEWLQGQRVGLWGGGGDTNYGGGTDVFGEAQ